jgi:hypothetical protein
MQAGRQWYDHETAGTFRKTFDSLGGGKRRQTKLKDFELPLTGSGVGESEHSTTTLLRQRSCGSRLRLDS